MLSAPLTDVISMRNVLFQTILGQGSTLHVHTHPSQAGNFTEMMMMEKPTSRKQAQLLSSWYQEQLHNLMSLSIPTPDELREFLNPAFLTTSCQHCSSFMAFFPV